jgi:hypothetical protein
MQIEVDTLGQVLVVDGKAIPFLILGLLADPKERALYRFHIEDDTICVQAFTELQVVWLEESDLTPPKEIL